MKKLTSIFVVTLGISLSYGTEASARIITEISPPTGSGLGNTFCTFVQTPVETPNPNNDNTIEQSQNVIPNFPGLSCTPITYQNVAPVDTSLFVEPSGGTTEYFVSTTVVNETNTNWNGFRFQIGFGNGNNFAPPELILLPAGVIIPSFDEDTEPTSSQFTQLIQDGSFSLVWSGGNVAPGESVDFSFSLDVPDDLAGLNFYESFTIRATPVPEPFTLLGVATSIGMGAAFKHKQQKKSK
ncbi:hypothetical protein PCC7424_0651 [Gloeothece citriformis PCC 7424]|uniref:PEP-CTERM protein-sorting domain-containing protein n=1 Tax=Gloeothece citriformis (strain PCC 7424) TaxID=65393 RepID=B7KET5_GLOC7|nr:PEP-CTERM sorting domain-containing protein [Gloeothece citriformis]ACK69110.1 hypothetical protein PCC7424_0651 [Gloeothece citriformis PCC 7424]